MLHVRAWPDLLERLSSWWAPLLAILEKPSISLEIDGESLLLAAPGGEASVTRGRDERRHLWVPPGWAGGLLTGKRCAADLLFEEQVRERSRLTDDAECWLRTTFSGGAAQWLFSPAYED